MRIPILFLFAQLALSALLPGRSLDELAKLHRLVQHYHHHFADHGSISFFDFVDLHYGAPSGRHDHEEHHEELPFKTVTPDVYFCLTLAVFPCDPGVSALVSAAAGSSTTSIKVAEIVWHPPRS